jgi:ribonuclease P/MRP protein subunit RPP40
MRKLMVTRSKLSRRLLKTKSVDSVLSIKKELEDIESLIIESHTVKRKKDEAKVTAVLKDDPAAFYKYAARFSKSSSKIGPLKLGEDSHTSDESTMAEVLSNQYKSVFSVPQTILTEELIEDTFEVDPLCQEPQLTSITFNNENVEKALSSLSGSASPGPDGITALCLKRGGSLVVSALIDVFQTSLNTSNVDSSMRSAFITPIWKGGDRSLTINYRPVSLSSHLSKTMERAMRPQIVDHLEANGKIDQAQHGARSGRSTLSQLLIHYDRVLKLIENGSNCDQLYLDLSKAFDKVDHSLLIKKLAAMGIRGKLGTWLGLFLMGRTQAVRVGSKISSWSSVISGVPQGTVLGPLFFLCFITDLGGDLDLVSTMILKFVDDTKLIKGVSSPEDIEDLQEDLEKLYKWQSENNMEWNGSKFQALRMGYDKTLREETMLFTPDHEDPIEEMEVVKDLGVLMDRLGNFGPQRAKANAKAKQKAGWILRTFRSRDLTTMRTLWNSLVRPHQDYCSQLWSPVGLVGDLLEQEAPLRSFSRRIRGFSELNYWERLAAASLYSSERRQERYKILYAFKAIRGLVPFCGLEVDTDQESRRGRTIKVPLIQAPRTFMAVKTLREKSFQVEAPKLFNALPAFLRNLNTTIETFKAHLDSFLETIPDQPATPGLVPAATNLSGRPSNSIRDWARHLHSSSN